jgi:hypothetical protein
MGLSNRIDALKSRHQELDHAIEVESTRVLPNEVELHSLKKEKLRIKDELETLTQH